MTQPRVDRVIVEADGGSRGNPGPAAYGAVLKDATSGAMIAQDGCTIGTETNNVAEYSGLIAGLRLAADVAPGAQIEVRMDSKLVVEQMSGNWKISHPEMRTLAAQAAELAPASTRYVWVPREENSDADRLVNLALDGLRSGVEIAEASPLDTVAAPTTPAPARGWSRPVGPPTTLILIRHGVTPLTAQKRFSGGLASSNPGLSDEGRDQVKATAQWVSPAGASIDSVIASPVRRTRESGEIVAAALGLGLAEEPGFAEMEFGVWDGLTFAEVSQKFPGQVEKWVARDPDYAPEGGETLNEVRTRVLAALDRVLDKHRGQTVAVVSHVTPIKLIVSHCLGIGIDGLFTMELSPASVTVVSFFTDDDGDVRGSLRLFNGQPPGADPFSPHASAWFR